MLFGQIYQESTAFYAISPQKRNKTLKKKAGIYPALHSNKRFLKHEAKVYANGIVNHILLYVEIFTLIGFIHQVF